MDNSTVAKLQLLELRVQQLKETLEVQSKEVNVDTTDYMIGLYNGLELAVAIIDNRTPEFKRLQLPDTNLDDIGNPHTVDKEEQTKEIKYWNE